MEENPNYEYFEKGSFDISEQLIKEQGSEVCRNIIDKYYINVKSKDYDFGFIYKTPVDQIGQARSKRNLKYNISSFILCKLNPKFEDIEISLVCSKPNKKQGKMLIDLVIMKALEMKYKYISLLSIGETKLVNWYKKQGFEIVSSKYLPSGAITNDYYMRKNILLDNK